VGLLLDGVLVVVVWRGVVCEGVVVTPEQISAAVPDGIASQNAPVTAGTTSTRTCCWRTFSKQSRYQVSVTVCHNNHCNTI
jgi:hypothetical protein